MRAIADRITRDNTDGVIFFPPIFMPVITVLPWAIACVSGPGNARSQQSDVCFSQDRFNVRSWNISTVEINHFLVQRTSYPDLGKSDGWTSSYTKYDFRRVTHSDPTIQPQKQPYQTSQLHFVPMNQSFRPQPLTDRVRAGVFTTVLRTES
jgi:hypothetical protein